MKSSTRTGAREGEGGVCAMEEIEDRQRPMMATDVATESGLCGASFIGSNTLSIRLGGLRGDTGKFVKELGVKARAE